jgi:glycosyltransferase involved in cell wall biosynthesis
MVSLADGLGIGANLSFLGLRRDIARLLSTSDALVLSSDWEAGALAVQEAMAAAKPVIATAIGGIPEAVVDGVTGFLIPRGDARSMADAMVRLADDETLRLRMGQEGRKRAKALFDLNRFVLEHEKLYLRVLGEPIE